jgi:molybdate transport system ATP-binding protein
LLTFIRANARPNNDFMNTKSLRVRLTSRAPIALHVDFDCAAGELVALVGPSGSGKTTLLRAIAGLHRAADLQGEISVGGQSWFANLQANHLGGAKSPIFLPPQARRVGMVFQQYALFPHLSALQNIAINDHSTLTLGRFSVNSAPNGDAESAQQLAALMARLGLADLAQRLPGQLSGGQQQRVALARALWRLTTQGWGAAASNPRAAHGAPPTHQPLGGFGDTVRAAAQYALQDAAQITTQVGVLLLDEPFSAVDAPTRQALYTELASLRQHLAVPMVLVTHDLAEARRLADRVVIIDAGQSLQSGTPAQVFGSPRNARVAQLVGIQNHFSGVFYRNVIVQSSFIATDNEASSATVHGVLQWGSTRLQVLDKGKIADNTAVTWVLAAQHVEISHADDTDGNHDRSNRLRCTLVQRLELGEMCVCQLRVELVDSQMLNLNLSTSFLRALQAEVGTQLDVLIPPQAVHIMPLRA